jgi:hypothetical protein
MYRQPALGIQYHIFADVTIDKSTVVSGYLQTVLPNRRNNYPSKNLDNGLQPFSDSI